MATTYIVLRQTENQLLIVGAADTITPRQAIKAFSEPEGGALPGRYVAVPLRNWTQEDCEVVQDVRYLTGVPHIPGVLPGRTTIEREEEASQLAEAIGGEDTPVGEQIDETARRRADKKIKAAEEEFGPEVEETFDPTFPVKEGA